MNRGYVKLWRKSLDNPLMRNPEAWALWCYLLLRASHQPHKHLVGNQIVELAPGQLVVGRKALATVLGLSERKIRTSLDILVKLGNVTSKATNKFSVITIENWGRYQHGDQQGDQLLDQQAANKRPTDGHKQEFQELKNIKKNKKSASHSPVNSAVADSSEPHSYPSGLQEFVDGFIVFVQQEHGAKAPKPSRALITNSLDTVDKLIRLDGHPLETVKIVMRWAVADDFWSKNALSLAGLRKKKDGLTKFQKILASYERGHSEARAPLAPASEDTAEYGGGARIRSYEETERCRTAILRTSPR